NYNGAETIGRCLDAAFKSRYTDFEVIVVDDFSSDNSTAIIEKYPCRLIRLNKHAGASKTRNTGAEHSRGEDLFFIDSDCLLQPDTIAAAAAAHLQEGPEVIIGGTYTQLPYDQGFFSVFQSVFIHYSETKNLQNPDYIATHAMVIGADLFKKLGGFDEHFMPILEDVEFSHRLKEKGYRLRMNENILVQHIFNFNLVKSMRNGIRKSKYWSIYSLKNRDLLADSGTASQEFKFNVMSCFINLVLIVIGLWFKNWAFVFAVLLLLGVNLYLNRQLIRAFHETGGTLFATFALLYYTLVYPFAVGIGACSGIYSQHFGLRP
ncbi:MAG: glycosyltransferase family A protein, partial [Desulfobulbales bacterium]|nr:glycosyltransferase family A protein [Desulfobulbales bacterium]